MKKKQLITLILSLFVSSLTFAQVGIGTNDPKATLDVVGKPTVPTSLDAVIPPRISKSNLGAKTYTADQNGALVFVDLVDPSTAIQVSDVFDKGYHYFDGTNNRWYAVTNYIKAIGATTGTMNDAIPTEKTISSTNLNLVTTTLSVRSFTLTRKSIVSFESVVTVHGLYNASGASLTDGRLKILGSNFRFTTFESTLSSKIIRLNSTPITNSADPYSTGTFRLNGSKKLILEPGDYVVELQGSVFAADPNGIRASFGTSNDTFDIFVFVID